MPSSRGVLIRLLSAWVVGLVVFGYGPAFTYGALTWLLNETQWRWALLMYVTEVPLVGGLCVILWPWLSYRPIHQALRRWERGEPVDPTACAAVYERALSLPWKVALG